MNTKRTERIFDIVNGPSISLLFDACKYAYDRVITIPVNFTVVLAYIAPKDNPSRAYIAMPISDIVIAGIEHEDGSGSSFNLYGYCKANLDTIDMKMARTPYKFEAYYNVRSRKGTIIFLPIP